MVCSVVIRTWQKPILSNKKGNDRTLKKKITMGWTGINTQRSFDEVFQDEFGTYIQEGKIIRYAEVKSSETDSTFYLAVRRQNGAIGANVIIFRKEGKEVLYKEMDEGMGPHSYNCPQNILNLLSPIEKLEYPGYAKEWREKQKNNQMPLGI